MAGSLNESGIECESIKKLHEGRPNIVDTMHNGETQFVLNTPVARKVLMMTVTYASLPSSTIFRTTPQQQPDWL